MLISNFLSTVVDQTCSRASETLRALHKPAQRQHAAPDIPSEPFKVIAKSDRGAKIDRQRSRVKAYRCAIPGQDSSQ